MHKSSLSSSPFEAYYQCPFEAKIVYLLSIPPYASHNTITSYPYFTNYHKILSTHGSVFSTTCGSPTNPFTPRLLFPPKGEWSLHTHCTNKHMNQESKEDKQEINGNIHTQHTRTQEIHTFTSTTHVCSHNMKISITIYQQGRKENSMDHETNLSPSNGNVSCSRAPSFFLQTLEFPKSRE